MNDLKPLNFSNKQKLPIVISAENAECGMCALTMVAGYHGHDVDLNSLRQLFGTSTRGMKLNRMIEIAAELGLTSRAIRTELNELAHLKTPAILHWDLSHFVVLKSANSKYVTVHDPAFGVRKLTISEASNSFTGVALELWPSKEFSPISARQKMKLSSLWSKMDGLSGAISQVLILSTLLQVAVFTAPFYLQLVIDQVLQSNDTSLLNVLALSFAALLLLQIFLTVFRALAVQSIGALLSYQMTGNVVNHLMRLPIAFFEKRHIGDVLSRLQSVTPIRDALTTGVATVLIDGVMSLIAVAILFVYSPLMACIVLVGVFSTAVFTMLVYPLQRQKTEENIVAQASENSFIIESIRGVRTVKLFGREGARLNKWRNLFAEYINTNFALNKHQVIINAIQLFIPSVTIIFIVYVGANLIISNAGFSIGMLFAFMSYQGTLTDRAIALINQTIAFRYITLHLDRISDIAFEETEFTPGKQKEFEQFTGNIDVVDVSFSYDTSSPPVIDSLNLSIEQGEFIAITGKSGGGKSTLVRLLLGLHEPNTGQILLSGKSASAERWRSFRDSVGVVLQDDSLFSGTIAENIAFFDPDLDMDRVRASAAAAMIYEDIETMPMTFMTLIGDMGSSLSGGQKQRLMLARALYRQPSILLLDEGTANLDIKTENALADVISSLDTTKIVIAHRPALIERADKVYDLAGGKLSLISNRDLLRDQLSTV